MIKLVLLISLPVILLSLFLKAWSQKKSAGEQAMRITGKGLASALTNQGKEETTITAGLKTQLKKGMIQLSEQDYHTKKTSELSELLLMVGSSLYFQKDLSEFTKKTTKLTNILFPLLIVVCAFGFIARTLPLNICLAILLLSVMFNCLSHLYLTYFRFLSFLTMKKKLQARDLKIRESELETLMNYTHRNVFSFSAPKLLDLFLPNKG